MTPIVTLWLTARMREERAAEEPADLRDEVGDHHPHRGDRRERHAERETDREDVDAREHRDDERPGEVLADHAVEDARDLVGPIARSCRK